LHYTKSKELICYKSQKYEYHLKYYDIKKLENKEL